STRSRCQSEVRVQYQNLRIMCTTTRYYKTEYYEKGCEPRKQRRNNKRNPGSKRYSPPTGAYARGKSFSMETMVYSATLAWSW
ncbi:hypothetical protein COCCADRAFT_98088, partial [Bipolaris zeicola 26-R-13]